MSENNYIYTAVFRFFSHFLTQSGAENLTEYNTLYLLAFSISINAKQHCKLKPYIC